MSWRETAKTYLRQEATVVFSQLDQMEARLRLSAGDWVQVAGRAIKFEYGFQNSGNSAAVYMVTTKAIYASREKLFGKWKDMTPAAVAEVPDHEFSTVGRWTRYTAQTRQGHLAITVSSHGEAEAIARAVKDAYLHETTGLPLFRPDSPEFVASDPRRTTRESSSATADGLVALVAKFKNSYAEGDSQGIWAARVRYGYDISEDRFERRSDWFWFNAYPALSGLNLGKERGAPLSTFCGLAEQASDRNDPEERRVVDEIKARYQMGLS
jgi:hypothetical protein